MFIYIIEIAIVVFIVYVVLNIYYYKKINNKIELIQIDRETINKDKLIDYIYDKQPIIFTNMVEESDMKYWNFDYIKQYYPDYLMTIVSKYNSKRHMKVKIQNIPFDFNTENETENETEYYIEDYDFLDKSGMSDVLKDDLSLLFPFLSVGNTF